MSKEPFIGVDSQSAGYWLSPITKREAQDVFDEYAQILVGLQETILKQEFALACLLDKAGIGAPELQAFMDSKMEQHLALQKFKDAQSVTEVHKAELKTRIKRITK